MEGQARVHSQKSKGSMCVGRAMQLFAVVVGHSFFDSQLMLAIDWLSVFNSRVDRDD